MLIVMRKNATDEEIQQVCDAVCGAGLTPHAIPGQTRTAIGITGNAGPVSPDRFSVLAGVVDVVNVTKAFKLTSRDSQPEDTIVDVAGVRFGDDDVVVIAGPCAVESAEQMIEAARVAKACGADMLRGGAYKARTSPYSFQGLGPQGLRILQQAREETGLPVVSEAVDVEGFDEVEEAVDMVQIGARNMQNFSLLKRAGRSPKPILLKRGLAATLSELLLAAEYIMAEGNPNVVLCERGVRSFSDFTRFTLDLSIVPEIHRVSHLPVIVDPSHAVGRRDLVIPMARAAVAAGADGILVEVHPDPSRALSDGPQAILPDMLQELMEQIHLIAPVVRRCPSRDPERDQGGSLKPFTSRSDVKGQGAVNSR